MGNACSRIDVDQQNLPEIVIFVASYSVGVNRVLTSCVGCSGSGNLLLIFFFFKFVHVFIFLTAVCLPVHRKNAACHCVNVQSFNIFPYVNFRLTLGYLNMFFSEL
jgi:hypothetical protein